MTPKVLMFNMDVGEQPKDGVTKDKEGCLSFVKLVCFVRHYLSCDSHNDNNNNNNININNNNNNNNNNNRYINVDGVVIMARPLPWS